MNWLLKLCYCCFNNNEQENLKLPENTPTYNSINDGIPLEVKLLAELDNL